MKRYEEYKKTGLTWLPEIPQNWKWRFLSQVAQEQTIRKPAGEVYPILTLTYGEIKRKKNIDSGLVPADYGTYQMLYKGNIVLRLIDLQNDHTSLRTGIVKEIGIITSAYTCIVPTENTTYLHYLLHSYDTQKVFYGYGGGVRQSIGFKDIRYLQVPVPPRDEQDQIVRFLDWKVSGINKLIRIRKRQIEELEAIKRSSIGYLVMGQAQSTPHRDTEVSWVKTIPAHWNEKTLIQVAEEQQIKNAGMVEDNLLSLSYGKIINKDINTTDGLLPSSFEGYQIVHDGNIILRLTDLQNDHKSLRTGLVTQTGIITSAYTCLKVRHNILPEYLQLQLHVADLCKVFYGMGGGVRQSIGFTEIRKLVIAIPPVEEQQYILDRVHGIEKPINCAIQNIRDIIAGLEDLKTRLISDAVTGKIDVRGIEIPEYEFVDEDIDNADENPEQGADEPPEEE